jgi:hypothetical protein
MKILHLPVIVFDTSYTWALLFAYRYSFISLCIHLFVYLFTFLTLQNVSSYGWIELAYHRTHISVTARRNPFVRFHYNKIVKEKRKLIATEQ